MSRDTVLLFLALLALFGQVALVVTAIAFAGGRRTTRLRTSLIDAVGQGAVVMALTIAVVATAGSLYLSEGAHFVPCKLCWYQRIAMYPLTIILGSAVARRRRDVHWYAIPLAGIGAVISSYHILLERFPRLESNLCEVSNPCTLIWTRRFGYQTIPTMALTAFVLIIVALLVGVASDHRDTNSTEGG
jgi:disulfide bond formation protein DsbB